jgi:trans-2,3-dihydro-3-hydroxyanthranilate isomerase
MAPHPLYLLDVFAVGPGTGNPLVVVLGADEVADDAMANLARRLRLSETSFVQATTTAGASYRHRIWMPSGEAPFAGHPSVGTAVAVAIEGDLAQAVLVQETPSGLQRLEVTLDTNRRGGSATLRQGALRLGPTVDPAAILRAFGLGASDAHPMLPAQLATTGLDTLLLPLASVDALGRARIDVPALTDALKGLEAPGWLNCYLVAQVDDSTWRARNLAPDIVGYEDPATGSAAGPLGGWLAGHGYPARITVLQGVEMGDPSHIDVDASDGVVISGRVLVRATGSIDL